MIIGTAVDVIPISEGDQLDRSPGAGVRPACRVALRTLTQAWTRDSRTVLARFAGPDNAARLDALLEGMIMHALLTTVPEPRETTRDTITRTLGPAGGPGA
ncbi:hypothetical protein ACFV0C_33070 [Streptomyces sp. NPDC059568]|uniref:hypothetical protein n=1 Tax=Streptomyces sp. NPDC059568 TaxID=3346868 RepID=UPI0036AE1ACB